MPTESSPGQGAPQEDQGWAFRPRASAPGPQPYREERRAFRQEQRAYGDDQQTYRDEQQTYQGDQPTYRDDQPIYQNDQQTYRDDQATYQNEQPTYQGERRAYRDGQQAHQDQRQTYRDQQQAHQDQRQTYRHEQPAHQDQRQTYGYDQRAYQQEQPTYHREEQRAYQGEQRTAPAGQRDDGWPAPPYGASPGTRWDTTMPMRAPEPRTGAHDALDEQDRRTPPRARRGDGSADRSGRPSATAGVPAPATARRPEPAAAQPRPRTGSGGEPAPKPKWVGRMALALVVLVAAGGASVVLFEEEDAAAVASKQLTREWQIPAPAADDALIGSWLTDKLLVRASSRGGLRAYDLTDGKQVWSAKFPAPAKSSASAGSSGTTTSSGATTTAPGTTTSSGTATPSGTSAEADTAGSSATAPTSGTSAEAGTVPCAMSPTLGAHGIGTVAFGKDGSTCTRLAGVDASTGRILWSMPLTSTKHPAAATASTHVQGDVATIVSENFLGGVDLRTGSRVWGYKARGHYCNAYDWGTAGTVLVDDFCLDQKTRFTLTAYDGKTGKVIWRKPESAHSDVTHILSGSPLVASVHTARQDAVRVFDTHGTGRKLAVGNDELTSGNTTGADHSARLYGKVLVTPASAAGSTQIDAFDTTTGAKLWTARSAALAVPASGAHDKVYAVTLSGSPQLIGIDPRTGRTTPIAGLPVGTGKWSFTSGTVYVTPDGGVLVLNALGSNGGVRLYR
ncbi:outer membrane protein assembly factor BamB family protein [Streptomyces sp. NPDC002516]